MSIIVKKVIRDVDYGETYARWVDELPRPHKFDSIASNVYATIKKPSMGLVKEGSLIADDQFNHIIDVGSYGLYYLILQRDNVCLKEIEVEPREVIVDIHPQLEPSNSLMYVFYNGSLSASAIAITAKVVNDGGETCQKLRGEEKDMAWREYIVKLSMKKATHMSAQGRGKAPDIMTAEEVATYVGLAVKTIRNWTSENKIPSHKIHGAVRYRKAEIDEYIDKNKKITPRIKKKSK